MVLNVGSVWFLLNFQQVLKVKARTYSFNHSLDDFILSVALLKSGWWKIICPSVLPRLSDHRSGNLFSKSLLVLCRVGCRLINFPLSSHCCAVKLGSQSFSLLLQSMMCLCLGLLNLCIVLFQSLYFTRFALLYCILITCSSNDCMNKWRSQINCQNTRDPSLFSVSSSFLSSSWIRAWRD